MNHTDIGRLITLTLAHDFSNKGTCVLTLAWADESHWHCQMSHILIGTWITLTLADGVFKQIHVHIRIDIGRWITLTLADEPHWLWQMKFQTNTCAYAHIHWQMHHIDIGRRLFKQTHAYSHWHWQMNGIGNFRKQLHVHTPIYICRWISFTVADAFSNKYMRIFALTLADESHWRWQMNDIGIGRLIFKQTHLHMHTDTRRVITLTLADWSHWHLQIDFQTHTCAYYHWCWQINHIDIGRWITLTSADEISHTYMCLLTSTFADESHWHWQMNGIDIGRWNIKPIHVHIHIDICITSTMADESHSHWQTKIQTNKCAYPHRRWQMKHIDIGRWTTLTSANGFSDTYMWIFTLTLADKSHWHWQMNHIDIGRFVIKPGHVHIHMHMRRWITLTLAD